MPPPTPGTPQEAFQRIKQTMRRHWLEQLEADLKQVEEALRQGTQTQPQGLEPPPPQQHGEEETDESAARQPQPGSSPRRRA